MPGKGQVVPENHPLIVVRGFFYRFVRCKEGMSSMRCLNGWQRIGVIFSVCWVSVAAVLAYQYYNYTGFIDPLDPPTLLHHVGPFFGYYPPSVVVVLATFVLPITGGWLLVYMVVWTTKWMIRGFKSETRGI